MANSERRDDIHVPDIKHPPPTAEEATWYTTVTCEPDDSILSGNNLRHYDEGTELVIAMTMCNENQDMFSGTMKSCVAQALPICAN
jgi:hypothetical protein